MEKVELDELSEKEVDGLRRLWVSGWGHLAVESSNCSSCLRPRIAKSLVEKKLITIESGKPCFDRIARLAEDGHDLCMEHDNEWSEEE